MSDGTIGGLCGLAFILAFWFCIHRLAAGRPAKKLVRRLAMQHRDALGLKWIQTTRTDEDGKLNLDAWLREVEYFVDNVIWPEMGWFQRRWLRVRAGKHINKILIEVAFTRAAEIEAAGAGPVPTDTLAYEVFIASELRRLGWSSVITGKSGGQRIDVAAEKRGCRLVIQCKLYSQPVGDAAVREAIAGKAFARADYAAVVTNASFMPHAHQLAETTGVLLLHDSQLGKLDRLCGIGSAERIA